MADDKSGSPKDSHYARLRRTHRDQKAGQPGQPQFRPRRHVEADELPQDGFVRLYGIHTVRAALDNPSRKINRLYVTKNALDRLDMKEGEQLPYPVEIVEPKAIDKMVGSDAVHQGALLVAEPLKPKRLDQLASSNLVLVLDQVTDPHNVGAVIRSAVAFGAGALIVTARHSPSESGVLAKSASGALEHLPIIEVRNLASALDDLHATGFRTVGLDSEGPELLEKSLDSDRVAIVLGAEGKGLRQKTRETVSVLARLDMPGPIKSLNVSNAAAVALYAARQALPKVS